MCSLDLACLNLGFISGPEAPFLTLNAFKRPQGPQLLCGLVWVLTPCAAMYSDMLLFLHASESSLRLETVSFLCPYTQNLEEHLVSAQQIDMKAGISANASWF